MPELKIKLADARDGADNAANGVGEVVAAARAIVRTLKVAGADIHVLAERVETANGSKLTDAKMRKL